MKRDAQFAVAVPYVMAHRAARMMRGSRSRSDRYELSRMVTEKMMAFSAAWAAMAFEAARAQQRLALAWWSASIGIATKGLAPIQRQAIANARRLSR